MNIEKNDQSSEKDKGTLNLPFIMESADKNNKFLTGKIYDLRLYTALQPIYSVAHKRVVGYEALVRAKNRDNEFINPSSLFNMSRSSWDQIFLDRLCRYIHINNFLAIDDPLNWLFLNVSPQTILNGKAYGSYFKELLELFNFPAHRIVIEVVEQPIEDNRLLIETINYYKSLGCLIAIDDFGSGHSNFDRIWTIKPDIVKLDRSFIVRASGEDRVREMLSGIVSLLHQAGSLVLLEGIETMDQAMMAVESDVDFVQGFYFNRPFTNLTSPFKQFKDFDSLFEKYKAISISENQQFQEMIKNYKIIFTEVVEKIKNGESLKKASKRLFLERSVIRCYQIGTDGIQIGSTIVSKLYHVINDKRFKPIEDAKNADWFRRHYLKRAILHPEQLQVTRPYLSITGAHMCITLSMQFSIGSNSSVLCCDIGIPIL
ncbi:MAG: EAL domain-containing protein [Desulfamplus sp.]|nr:EAL domain-containing protein [Desulfamplus sp.]